MSGARTMQEFKYFRDGATLVISLDGLNWLPQRRSVDKKIKKRDEELPLVRADEERQTITCFCILDQRGRSAPQLWRNCTSSLVTWQQSLSIPPRQCRPQTHHSVLPSLAPYVSESPKEAPWTKLIFNMQDILSFIKKDSNIGTHQDAATKNLHNGLLVFCDEDLPLHLLGDHTEDGGRSTWDTGWHTSDESVLSDLKTGRCLNGNNCKGIQHELVSRDSRNNLKSLLKSCQIYSAPGVSCGRDTNVKERRKSVSFDEDVMVYLFDQESPIAELHSGPCTSLPGRYPYSLPDVSVDDSGLEWEDDFSALEKSGARNVASQHCTLPLPKRFILPQTCLFLTHIAESDLEL